MAKYQIINVKPYSGDLSNGNGKFDNEHFLCFTDAPGKYLTAGPNTTILKIRRDDFNYALRAHGYSANDLPDKIISPIFDENGYMTDFTLSDPDTGEVIGK